MTVMVGTSGWQYRSWKGPFYQGLPQKEWLERYASAFQTVEVNNAFYRLPAKETFARWRERTPDDFIISVKVSRYITHVKRLRDPDEPVRRFTEHIEALGKKLGPVLLQLPPNLAIDVEHLERALWLFPKSVRVAVEPRHDSWFVDEVRDVLEKAGAALCLADGTKRKTPLWRTANWGYVRFHDGVATPRPCYGRRALDTWAEHIADLWTERDDVYAYFNNDTNVCAVRDAGVFARACERKGLSCSRHPERVRIERESPRSG